MKRKFCLCYCPSVIEADDDSDLRFSSNKIINPVKKTQSLQEPSFLKHNNKSLHKIPSYSRRKIFSYKYFPRLFKAILFQDPLRNIQQLEIELKGNVGWKEDDEKRFKKLKDHESGKLEMEVEQVSRIPQETVNSVSHESEKSIPTNWTKPNTSSSTSTSSSCDQKKKDSCSLLYLIVFALLITIFLGKYWAIMLTLSWLYSIPYRSQRLPGEFASSILTGCTPTESSNAMKSS